MGNYTDTEYKSVCRSCHGGCGTIVTVRDGRVTRVKGDRSSPLNRGWMCIKGARAPEVANHPDRLQHPLKRAGDRGSGQWQRVSWDEALDDIASKLREIREKSGPESIVIGQGTGRHHYMHTVRFANSLGTPNWYEPGCAQCLIPRITVSQLTYGNYVVADYYGETNPACILFWGHNPEVSCPDGELASLVTRAMDGGSIGIAVDPRRSETAKRCKHWLPIRPGTDAALALAMIRVIIERNLYDREFVETWTRGFDELKTHVAKCTPQWASEITWIDASDIVEAATTYATVKPAVLEWGVGIEQNANSLQTVRALAILRALTGNIDIPGGDVFGMNILRPYPTLRDKLPKDMAQKRLAEGFKLLGGRNAHIPSAHIPSILRAMRDGEPYQVRSLLVFGGNPLMTVADSVKVSEALARLDFLVVTDLFMTPTAALADYVLPAAFWTEVEQIIAYPLVAENLVIAQQKTTQVGECRQDEWIMDELSKRLDLPGSDQTYKDIMNYQLEPLGISYKELLSKQFVQPPQVYRKYEKKGFKTPSRKVELNCKSLERMGYDALPSFREPFESPITNPELAQTYPYILITGARRKEFFHSEGRQVSALRKRRPDPIVEIPPKIAKARSIASDEWVIVESPRGKMRAKALVTEDIREGVVSVEHGWWFPEKDDLGIWESNANVLTSIDPPYDPAFGTYCLRGLLCNVSKEY